MKRSSKRGGKARAPFEKSGKPQRRFKKSLPRAPRAKEEPKKAARPASPVVIGVVAKASFGWTLVAADKRDKAQYIVRNPAKAESLTGELVTAKLLPSTKRGRQEIEIAHQLSNPNDPRAISLIAIHANEIPHHFPDEVLKEAEAFASPPKKSSLRGGKADEAIQGHESPSRVSRDSGLLRREGAPRNDDFEGRTDLRALPLVTIDGADSRDFDDAVFAEKDGNGWHIVVAIADVAHYVRPGSALDREAYKRGNSTYFPDRVVPMLPETLSNDLCSLMPDADRACLAAHIWIDREGEIKRWQFVRGVMRSHARLTYEQVQAAQDGKPDAQTAPLLEKVIAPLYGAFAALMQARLKRGTLGLDLPERKVHIAKDGTVKAITVRERLDSHKLIEEFMIAANVAAAAQLEGFRCQGAGVCLYRIHDKPTEIKLESLRDFLDTLGISLVPARQLHPRLLTQILEKAAGTENAQVVNEVMLRSQSQAIYSPENIGHFGLALARYAHFTSPIRRYADLIVHRGLIRACKLGEDGLTDGEVEKLEEIGEHISTTERRSAIAERDATDRFTALFLGGKVGAVFPAHISGVARFGLFARLDETGADGIIPFAALPRDYYELDEKQQALVGQRTGRSYRLAAPVKVRLETADRLTGSMSCAIVEEEGEDKPARKPNRKQKPKRLPPRKAMKRK